MRFANLLFVICSPSWPIWPDWNDKKKQIVEPCIEYIWSKHLDFFSKNSPELVYPVNSSAQNTKSIFSNLSTTKKRVQKYTRKMMKIKCIANTTYQQQFVPQVFLLSVPKCQQRLNPRASNCLNSFVYFPKLMLDSSWLWFEVTSYPTDAQVLSHVARFPRFEEAPDRNSDPVFQKCLEKLDDRPTTAEESAVVQQLLLTELSQKTPKTTPKMPKRLTREYRSPGDRDLPWSRMFSRSVIPE